MEWSDEVKEEINVDESSIEQLVPCAENLVPLNQVYCTVLTEMTQMLEDYQHNMNLPWQMRQANIIAKEERCEQLRASVPNEDRALEVQFTFFPLIS